MLTVSGLNPKYLRILDCSSLKGSVGCFFLFISSFPCLLFHRFFCILIFSLIDILVGKVQYLEVRLCFPLLALAKKATFAPDYEPEEASAYKGLQLKFNKLF